MHSPGEILAAAVLHVSVKRGGLQFSVETVISIKHACPLRGKFMLASRVRALRKPDMPACEDRLVMQAAQQQLVHFSGFNTSVCASWTPPYRLHLATACPLLARKFGPETADALTELMKQSEFLSQAKLEQLE